MAYQRGSLRGLQSLFDAPADIEPDEEQGSGDPFIDTRTRMMRPIAPDMSVVNPTWARWFDLIKQRAGGRDINLAGYAPGRSAFQPVGAVSEGADPYATPSGPGITPTSRTPLESTVYLGRKRRGF